MKKKLHFKLLLLLCAMVMGIGSAWAEETSYTITFNDTGTDSDSSTKITSIEDIIKDGATYVSSITNTSNVYKGRSGRGLKLGTSSKTGSLTLNLATAVTPTKITFKAMWYKDGESSITVNGEDFTNLTSNITEYTVNYDGNTEISAIAISTPSKRAYITEVSVYYGEGGTQPTTLEDSDFALTGTTDLSFDLYDNSAAQTISYTTSSTGAVTVSASEYIETVVDEVTQTITVTPKKKTNEAQTITVSQAADDTYKAGSATFTVTITDSTPTTGDGQWVLTDLADLVEGDVFVIVGNNGSTYAMSNNNGASTAPSAVAVTVVNDAITGDVADNIQWNIGIDNGYIFYPNGSTTTWLYCINSNNGVRVGTGEAMHFSLSDGGYLTTTETTDQRYIGIYNSSDWRCYKKETESNIQNQTFAFYKKVISGVTPPSISAYNVDLAYDATSGSITYTINNGVEGGTVSASTEAQWLTIGTVDETIPFTCSANTEATERTATVTLTYAYGDNETVTKNVTVTQAAAPVILAYSTIPDLFAAATSTETDVNVTFDSWVVSGVSTNGKNVFVTDGTNGFVIYNKDGGLNETYAVGNILSGTAVSCKLVLFNGSAEITNLNASDLTIATGGTVSAANIALADLAGVNTGALVSYENLTCSVDKSKYYLSDGITTLQVYNSLYAFEALEDGKIYNITGIFQQYGDTKEILPRSEADIEEVEVQHEQYTLTVSNLNHVNTFVFDASEQNEMLWEGVGSISVYDGTSVLISVDVEQGYVLESLMVDGEDVTSQIDETGAYTFTMPTHDVTVTATAVEATTYTLATAIVPGKHYVFASGTNGSVYAMGKMKSTNREAVQVTANNGTLVLTGEEGAYEFVINGPDANGNYTIYDESELSTGYLYAAGGTDNNHLKVQNIKDANSEWTISINNNGVATIKAKMDGDVNNRNWMRFNNGSSKIFSCYNSGQQDIYLFEKDGEEDPVETVTITTAKYATFCSEKAVDFSQTGVTVYKAKANDDTKTVTFSAISEGIVPAYTGVILYKEAAGELTAPVSLTKGTSDWSDNEMVGTYERTMVERTTTIGDVTKYNYILQNSADGIVFNRAKSANEQEGYYMPAGKAYLSTTVDAIESRMMVSIEGDTTGINTVNGEGLKVNGYYNLNGQRVDNPQKGLYIVNGKKVMVK